MADKYLGQVTAGTSANSDHILFNDVSDTTVDATGSPKIETKSTFLSGKADVSHTHAEADVTGLTTDLAAKVPTTRTVNSHALGADISLTASDVGAVPTTRTVNGHALSANVTVSADDVLPTQTGNSGKFLTTDGSTASWGTPAVGGGGSEWTDLGTMTFTASSTETLAIPTAYDLIRVEILLTQGGNNRPQVILNGVTTNYFANMSNAAAMSGSTLFDLWSSNGSTNRKAIGTYIIEGRHGGGAKGIMGQMMSNNVYLTSGVLAGDSNDLSSLTVQASVSTFTGIVKVSGKDL